MIWLAWRQFRAQALVTVGLLIVFAAVVLVTGLHLRDVYSTLGGSRCAARSDCTALFTHDRTLAGVLGPALLAIPALLGMFWGAPLVARELENGTYRLAWTQSITRRHWLVVRVMLIGTTALVVAGLATWLVTWWFAPLDAVHMKLLHPAVFAARGIVTIGYSEFTFALGIATGALLRRTLPAMAVTLAGFVAALGGVTFWVLPHLPYVSRAIERDRLGHGIAFNPTDTGITTAPLRHLVPNEWILSTTVVDRVGHPIGLARVHRLLQRACPADGPLTSNGRVKAHEMNGLGSHCDHWISAHLRLLVTYQGPSHYWPLQAIDTTIFLTAAVLILAATVWRTGRRTSRKPSGSTPRARPADPLTPQVLSADTHGRQ
jgi:hypothetical protein